jgi:hypothetical protein
MFRLWIDVGEEDSMIQPPKKSLVANAADEAQVKKAENRLINGREQEMEDVRFVLSTPSGRRFLWRWLEICGIYKTSMTGNSTTFFNEGMRSVGLSLLADIVEAQPDAYLNMQKEHWAQHG